MANKVELLEDGANKSVRTMGSNSNVLKWKSVTSHYLYWDDTYTRAYLAIVCNLKEWKQELLIKWYVKDVCSFEIVLSLQECLYHYRYTIPTSLLMSGTSIHWTPVYIEHFWIPRGCSMYTGSTLFMWASPDAYFFWRGRQWMKMACFVICPIPNVTLHILHNITASPNVFIPCVLVVGT